MVGQLLDQYRHRRVKGGDADSCPRFSRPPVSGQAATQPQLWTQEDAQVAEQGPRNADECLKHSKRGSGVTGSRKYRQAGN